MEIQSGISVISFNSAAMRIRSHDTTIYEMAPFITLRRFSSSQKLLPLFTTQNIWLAILNPKGSEFIDYQ